MVFKVVYILLKNTLYPAITNTDLTMENREALNEAYGLICRVLKNWPKHIRKG